MIFVTAEQFQEVHDNAYANAYPVAFEAALATHAKAFNDLAKGIAITLSGYQYGADYYAEVIAKEAALWTMRYAGEGLTTNIEELYEFLDGDDEENS